MDNFVRNKLKEWDLCHLIPIFAKNLIDQSVFCKLSESDVKELIPQVGTRIRFVEKFKNVHQTDEDSVEEEIPTTSLTNSALLSPIFVEVESDEALVLDRNLEPMPTSFATFDVDNQHSFFLDHIRKTDGYDLKSILSNTIRGKYILGIYAKFGILNNDARNKLVEVIIESELDKNLNRRLFRDRFERLASAIAVTFPSEVKETYFSTVHKRDDSKSYSCGKLFNKYFNTRRQLRQAGLIANLKSAEDGKDNFDDPDDDLDKNLEYYIGWLKNNYEPWSTVQDYWKNTFNRRQQQLREFAIHEYYATYPVLKLNNGCSLLQQDFAQQYAEFTLTFYENWENFSNKSLKYASQSKDLALQKIVSEINNSSTNEGRSLGILKILSFALPPQTIKRNWKPTKSEVWDFFILHVKRIEDLEKELVVRQEKLKKFKSPLQPTPVIVGHTEDQITSSYVRVNDIMYKVATPLKAVELCFQLIHALNACYPIVSEHVWLVIQKALFGISKKYDRSFISVNSFLNAFNSI